MEATPEGRPEDVGALKAALAEAVARAACVEAELAVSKAKASDDRALIAHQRLEIEKLRRQLYGQRSERTARLLDQIELGFEELESSATEDEIAAERAVAGTTNVLGFTRRRPARQPFPQKVLFAVRNIGGESEAAWRSLLDDLVARGLETPNFVIIDGAPGLEKALGSVWAEALVQRCTVHKHRNLLAYALERLHEEILADYNDMIYAGTPKEIETRRKSFLRKWRLKCRAVADSLEEAGDRLFTFTRLPASQWKSARTTNSIERLHEEFKRRIKTPKRAAIGSNRRHAVLGSARILADHYAQG